MTCVGWHILRENSIFLGCNALPLFATFPRHHVPSKYRSSISQGRGVLSLKNRVFKHTAANISRHVYCKGSLSLISGARCGAVGWGITLQAGSIPDVVTGIFHCPNPSGCTMTPGSTQPLTEISTRNICWGLQAAGAYGWQTYHPNVPSVLKSGAPTLFKFQVNFLDNIFTTVTWGTENSTTDVTLCVTGNVSVGGLVQTNVCRWQ